MYTFKYTQDVQPANYKDSCIETLHPFSNHLPTNWDTRNMIPINAQKHACVYMFKIVSR